MRTENTLFPTRLLRVRELPGEVTKGPGKKKGDGSQSRFVAPYYLQDEEQDAILGLLEQAGLGDDEGRRLFITAAEYEVGAYRLAPDEEPAAAAKPVQPTAKSKAEVELEDLGRSAEQLLALLTGAHKTARQVLAERLSESDRFARNHDQRYLAGLELELGRIAAACRTDQRPPEPPPPTAPPLGENAKRLIQQLLRIYGECLELTQVTEQLETFSRILCIIRDSAQIAIPCDPETLSGLAMG